MKTLRYIFIFSLLLIGVANAQESNGGEVFTVVDKMPEFPGGPDLLPIFIQTNLKYPPESFEARKEGKVYLQFVVSAEGKIEKVVVLKGTGDANLDKEAIRLVKSMPEWTPGEHGGKKVAVFVTLPINFKIQIEQAVVEQPVEKAPTEAEKKAYHYFKLGIDQEREERYQNALAKYELCLKYDPTHNRAIFHKGLMELKLRDKKKACETWSQLKQAQENDPELAKIISQNCSEVK